MASELSALNAKMNVEKIIFGTSSVTFNHGEGWLAYPEELWSYTGEPIVIASRVLQGAGTVSVYVGNTLNYNRRIEFYIDQTSQTAEEFYISYVIAARNQ